MLRHPTGMRACFVLLCAVAVRALNNGIAFVPQMGYNSWYDMLMNPSADVLMETAAALASTGLQAAGYTVRPFGT